MDKLPDSDFWYELAHRAIDLITPTSADIWTSPTKVSILIEICRSLEPLGKEAETVGVNLALAKKEIPGFSLVRRERNGYVEAASIVSLLESLPVKVFVQILPEVLSWSGNVSENRYRKLCQLVGREPDKAAIRQAGDSVFLRRDPQSSQNPQSK